jgi:hypothetical protein
MHEYGTPLRPCRTQPVAATLAGLIADPQYVESLKPKVIDDANDAADMCPRRYDWREVGTSEALG